VRAGHRFGLTGTLVNNGSADQFTIQSLLGPVVMKVSPDFLFKRGYSTPLDIRVVRMSYLPEEARQKLANLHAKKKDIEGSDLLNIEKKLAISSRARLNFVVDFIVKSKKNSLVLFQNVQDGYGQKIYDMIRELDGTKEVFYVDGSTSDALREEYKVRMKSGENKILVATYLTFATGISIPNLHNIYLTESYKSEILIKQSLGRMMRLFEDKERAIVVDFVDDFSWKGKKNYLLKHSDERIEIYERENFDYRIYDVSF
jgi:superfamily II DNA or RNA helicase